MQFDQYIGFLIFTVIFLAGFWLMLFLSSILPYWIMGYWKEQFQLKKEAKKKDNESKE